MIALSLGSSGDEVRKVEQRLRELNFYNGSIDGVFGGGVQAGVKSFQNANGLPADGVVGPRTWTALFPQSEPPVAPSIAAEPVAQRCLALTGAFETSTGVPDCYCGLAGNFDGQGLSFGVLQWNLGQGTLQPLLLDMFTGHHAVAASIFHEQLDDLTNVLQSSREEQLRWAASIQDPRRCTVFEPWQGFFKALGRTPEFQEIQVEHAERIRRNAASMCQRFGVNSERALALMFDICVQNGSIGAAVTMRIRADFDRIRSDDPASVEVSRLRAIANRRAEAASPAFIEDVRVRKLTIANGSGTVHNVPYDLERQFGIRLVPFQQ